MAVKPEVRTLVRLAVVMKPVFVTIRYAVDENGYPVAKNRQDDADGNGDRAHRPDVHPHRHLERRCARGRNRSSETWNDAHRDQERRRADWKALDPSGKALQVLVQVQQL